MILKIFYIVLYFSECIKFILNLLDCESKLSCMVLYEFIIYEGGLKSFRPQHEDGSTRQ